MKKLTALILILVIVVSCSVSGAEYMLTENEKNFLGAWSMYADNGKGTLYVFIVVFLDNMEVVQRSMTFKNGVLSSDNKATGEWGGFTDKTIIFTLADTGMTAMIKEDGYMYMYFFKDLKMAGAFTRCPDMASVMGW